jgi:hypothetical protein
LFLSDATAKARACLAHSRQCSGLSTNLTIIPPWSKRVNEW